MVHGIKIKNYFVSENALNYKFTYKIIKNNSYKICSLDYIKELIYKGKISNSNSLYLTTFPGNFIKDCPCTPNYVSCGYKNINIAYNCNLNCSYCILQEYLTYPTLTLFVNIYKLETEIKKYKKSNNYLRFGSGELTDSLIWENLYPFSKWFTHLFNKHKDCLFEFKTKTDYVNNFPDNKNNKNIIISFSMNPSSLKNQEPLSASNEEKIRAMEILIHKGYSVGLHFDPIIYYDSWKQDYKNLIKTIFEKISPNFIAWISLGGLRFNKNLRFIIRKKHNNSMLLKKELVFGKDKKYRYPFLIRKKIFKDMINYLKLYADENIPVYFCMESEKMWNELLEIKPFTSQINKYLFKSGKNALKNVRNNKRKKS